MASTVTAMAKEYTEDAGTEPIMQMYASKQEGAAANQMYMGEGGVGSDATGKYFASYYIPTQVMSERQPGLLRTCILSRLTVHVMVV